MALSPHLAAPPLALLLASAAPLREIPYAPGNEEALVIPADSPVSFTGYDKDHVARFSGRFVMTGTFVFSCSIECQPPLAKWQVYGELLPDREVARRLPHWKIRNGDMRIYIDRGDRLARQVVGRDEVRAIRSGKLDDVRKHVSIVVDDYRAGIECDGATYSARFVALAKQPKIRRARSDDPEGC